MAARVQIVVDATDAASGVLRAISGEFGTLGALVEDLTAKDVDRAKIAQSAASVVIAGIKATVDAVKDAVNVTMEYAGSVRDLALVSGTGAEEASRMIQVLDDFQISAEDVTAATRAMTKQGLTPTIDTLANLSDQYLTLNDAQERNEFIIKNLGRAGLQWVNVLKQGGNSIRELSAGVNENLILTDEQIEKTEEYRLAMDELSDTIMGYKVAAVTGFLDAAASTTQARDALILYGEATEKTVAFMPGRIQEIADSFTRAQETAMAWGEAIGETVIPTAEDLTVATAEVSKENTSLLSLMTSLQGETDRYTQTQESLRAKMAELKQQYQDGQVPQEEYKTKVEEITGAMKANEKAHIEAGNKIAFSLIQQKMAVDGLSDAEFQALTAMGVQWGIFDQKVADSAIEMNNAANNMTMNVERFRDSLKPAVSTMTGLNEKVEGLANKSGQMWDYYVNIHVSGRFPNIPTGPSVSIEGGGQQACFIAGTLITMADGSQKAIEDVQVGDWVVTYDFGYQSFVGVPVSQVFHHPAEQTKSYLVINDVLGVTPNHKLYTPLGWVEAGELNIGDCLIDINDNEIEIISIGVVGESVPTYNLHVEHPDHNYYANNFLVHNKQMGGTVYAGAPYLVGERGAEPFIPSTNGRVLGHAESLHALGLQGGSGAGVTMYNYGQVTIAADSQTGQDLLTIR